MTQPSPSPDLSIVIPTYNERERLAELVTMAFAGAEAAGISLELVIVDDGLPDGTFALVQELARTYRIIGLLRAKKMGLGSAVTEGFRAATGAALGVMDADMSHPPAVLPAMFAAFRSTNADLLVGSRYVPGGATPDWPWRRRVMSVIACLFARPLSPIRDATSGFFLVRRDIARSAATKAPGFKICLELIVRAWPVRLVEFPYQFDDRQVGQSKMTTREGMRYLQQLWDLYLTRLFGPAHPPREYRRVSPVEAAQFGTAAAPKRES